MEQDAVPIQVALGDGPFQVVTISGVNYYQVLNFNNAPAPYLYFDVPNSNGFTDRPVYVQVFYLEYGKGFLRLEYDSQLATGTPIEQAYKVAEEAYGTFCANGRSERQAVFKLTMPSFRGRQNAGADFRIQGALGPDRLTIRKVVLMTEPPPFFVECSDTPWLRPYDGITTRTDVNPNTLDGKVLCGYQGWFNTPNDGAEVGYRHWSRDPFNVTASTLTVDYWPDVSDYSPEDLCQVEGMTHPDGKPAYLYSPYRKGPVLKHFRWMHQYGIDGIFLSRFIIETIDPKAFRHVNKVLANVREGCHREGRVWALLYDVSSSWPNMSTADIINDWKFLCDQVKIREDSRYLHHDGKPVVLLWGFSVEGNSWSAQQAAQVVSFFKNDPVYGGNYLIGGVNITWENIIVSNEAWADVFMSFDAISPWSSGWLRSEGDVSVWKSNYWGPQMNMLNELGKGYIPCVYPGFSWDNLKHYPPGGSKIPRNGGSFMWKQFHALKTLNAKTVFVAMFDEVDEGTAIFKVDNNPPTQGYFLTYEGMPSDWYLKLTGLGTQMLRGEIPLTDTIPTTIPFPNNDFRVAEVWVDFDWTGIEVGSQAQPVNTLGEGLAGVLNGGTIKLVGGANSAETMRITTPVRLQAVGGPVSIGAASPSPALQLHPPFR